MQIAFEEREKYILEKWISPSSIDHQNSSFHFEAYLVYDTETFEWVLKYDPISTCKLIDDQIHPFHPNSSKEYQSNEKYIRSYMVIPSYLLLYRLLLIFGKAAQIDFRRDSLWSLSILHKATQTLVMISEDHAGYRIAIFVRNMTDYYFIDELREFLNFLTLPFFPHKKLNLLNYTNYYFRPRFTRTHQIVKPFLQDVISIKGSRNRFIL
ncbi:hypothetical protein RF11_12345 [Thelohanellus kitauei]|uniref:Uncharacterized protein n=1 Tax=Thelohanellus kitauei TaxID=669202 RepID=A0A0C2J4W7_THEKT|nr:hypothetical protein RF11_12345 [Thelohanellus kitauei]